MNVIETICKDSMNNTDIVYFVYTQQESKFLRQLEQYGKMTLSKDFGYAYLEVDSDYNSSDIADYIRRLRA